MQSEEASINREIPDTHLIATLEALKVFADILRQQIIEVLTDSPKTVKQIAAELEIAPTKLYYHINLLEEHGLIRVVDTRVVSGIIEKQYDAAASHYRIKRSLLAPGTGESDEALDTAIDAMVEPMREDIRKGIAVGLIKMGDDIPSNRQMRIWRTTNRLPEAEADQFYARLEELLDEFGCDDEDEVDESAISYTTVVFIYPTISHKKRRKKE